MKLCFFPLSFLFYIPYFSFRSVLLFHFVQNKNFFIKTLEFSASIHVCFVYSVNVKKISCHLSLCLNATLNQNDILYEYFYTCHIYVLHVYIYNAENYYCNMLHSFAGYASIYIYTYIYAYKIFIIM